MIRVLSTTLNRAAFVMPGGASVRPGLQRWRGASIGRNVWIGLYVYIDDLHPETLSIGDNCSIGIRSTILTHFYWGPRRRGAGGRVVIERDVFIGPHCVILPDVHIGEGAVVTAGTVVSRNVPAKAVWGTPGAEAIAEASVPLTSAHGYRAFLKGIRPIARKQPVAGPEAGQ